VYDAWQQGLMKGWLLDGFNEVRKSEIHCSGKLNPDEAMFSWKGKSGVGGIPHLSFVKRKPKPLGLELKCVADAEIGVMLFMEIQEGAVRMGRKKYLNAYQATTACTLRLIEGCVPKDHNDQITAYIDAWFCSVKTAEALRELFQVDVIGCQNSTQAVSTGGSTLDIKQKWSEASSVSSRQPKKTCGQWAGVTYTIKHT